jgi:hypothetical protein
MNRLTLAAASLLAIQVIHGGVPAETSSEGYMGAITGALLIIASIVGLVGAASRKPWAPRVIGITGAIVAIGFILYHATPWHSPVTNPYFGEDKIGLLQWAPVVGAIAIGAWAAWEATQVRRLQTANA